MSALAGARRCALLGCAVWLAACVHPGPVLRVGTSDDYPPFARAGSGFDVEVATRFAAEHGLRIQWVRFRWPELERAVREERFDVAMSGITWRPERALVGRLTRAVAAGGPCVVGAVAPARIAVNRGGALERWTRRSFPAADVVAVDDNLSLPDRYRREEVEAFVTDSFELAHVREPGWPFRCQPPADRKVYWVVPSRAWDLAPALDAWLERSEGWLAERRAHWFGAPQPRDPLDHLVDLLARRLALMPAVASAKRARGRPIHDPEREARVLAFAREASRPSALEPAGVEALFRLQMQWARRVQERSPAGEAAFDLEATLRPAIAALGTEIVHALARAVPVPPTVWTPERVAPLGAWLQPDELAALQAAVGRIAHSRDVADRWLPTVAFRMPGRNAGRERYSAWFADSDGRVLYFGLSPFWELWWADPDDPAADLREPGDHLIGRFDLEHERFLPPLVVRRAGPDARGSVWDVLAHPSGRVYYTTFFEEMGSVEREGGDVRHFERLGRGLNELALGPHGRIYVTRYARDPGSGPGPQGGALVVVAPDGERLREIPIPASEAGVAAPKSLAVDPQSGEVWLNTDTFAADGTIAHETLVLAADGTLLRRASQPPELQFAFFDGAGRGWFAEVTAGELALRIRRGGAEEARLALGPLAPADFVQEIRGTPSGGVVLALWSGRLLAVEPSPDGFRCADVQLELPPDCTPPAGRSALYTAVVHERRLYATLFCGATILSAPRPEPRRRCVPQPRGAE